jgi:LPXTG-site transpeptidase (sortase) family protein
MSSQKEENPNSPNFQIWVMNNLRKICLFLGAAFIAASLVILFLIFGPLIKSESDYYFSNKGKDVDVSDKSDGGIIAEGKEFITPVDKNFGLVIPKISANAKVVANVDSNDSKIYQKALAQGVAHASVSALPNEPGNVFIFSHSGQDLLEANRYNAVFYLLGKLEIGDEVFLFYQGEKIFYRVKEKKIVSASDIQYMAKESQNSTLTLMTCWPVGTTWKRLIIIAEKV